MRGAVSSSTSEPPSGDCSSCASALTQRANSRMSSTTPEDQIAAQLLEPTLPLTLSGPKRGCCSPAHAVASVTGALAAINGVVATRNLEMVASDSRSGMPISAQPIILFNPEGRTANFIIPGLVAVLLQM